MQKLESERAYKILFENILSGRITQDTPLSERKLSDELGIGRTPIREALHHLARDRVVEMVPAKGTFVRRISLKEIHDIFEVRCSLESMAAFLAAIHGPSPELSEYGSIFREMITAFDNKDPNEMSNVGENFHREVIRTADNEMLLSITDSLRIQFQIAFNLPRHYDTSWVKQSVIEHLGILESIENRDDTLAQKLMHEHLTGGLETRMCIMRRFKDMQSPVFYPAGQNRKD